MYLLTKKNALVCVVLHLCFALKTSLTVSLFFSLFNLVEEKADAKVRFPCNFFEQGHFLVLLSSIRELDKLRVYRFVTLCANQHEYKNRGKPFIECYASSVSVYCCLFL